MTTVTIHVTESSEVGFTFRINHYQEFYEDMHFKCCWWEYQNSNNNNERKVVTNFIYSNQSISLLY
jgi:hypothetical protein